MAWQKTGTVSVTNGSPVVTGSGTNWVASLQAGSGFVGPDGKTYEVSAVSSNTALSLATDYDGPTAAGQSYSAFPTQSLAHELTTALQTLIGNYQSIYDKAGQGLFENGTSAAAGIGFDADRDTGLSRLSSNTLSLIAGAVEQLRLTGGKASGAAVQSSQVDADPNKLMKVGGFGLGGYTAPAPEADLDNLGAFGGIFHVDSVGANKPDFAANFSILSLPRHESLAAQLAFSLNTSLGQRSRAALRSKLSETTWADWAEIFTQASILGSVSQSGGQPTGALIEQGNNANGHYVRLADGTQICTHKTLSSAGASAPWVFPSQFSAPPAVTAAPEYNGARMGTVHGVSSSIIGFNAWNTAGSKVAVTCNLLAVGRWF